MTDEPKRGAPAAEISAALIDQSNALIGQGAGLQQALCLVAAGLFAIASAISETKPPQ